MLADEQEARATLAREEQYTHAYMMATAVERFNRCAHHLLGGGLSVLVPWQSEEGSYGRCEGSIQYFQIDV